MAVGQEQTDQATPAGRRKRPEVAIPERSSFVDSLQRSAGNRATATLLAVGQAKLTVGASDDRCEREADDVAGKVVRALAAKDAQAGDSGPDAPLATNEVQRRIQRRAVIDERGGDLDAETESAISSARSGGRSLAPIIRRQMEEAIGADFSTVNVHSGAASDALNDRVQASAFTIGNDIFFKGGMPDTGSAAGQELLAHELTHTVQQGAAVQRSTIQRLHVFPHDVTVQRDFSGAMKSAGRGIASAAKATGKLVEGSATAVKDAAVGVANKIHRSDFNDLNATQYLVSAGGKIEAINREVGADGTVVYYRTGSVTVGNGDRPTVVAYDQPIAMPDGWLPSVTHINGMMVKPNGGLGSAIRLQQELEKAGGEALLTTDVPSVLYTYSAHRGFVTDLAECVSGKLYLDDDATDRQTQIMLDAVRNQSRTTVSAHSRGTIKTDNAVRNAHAQLSAEFLPAALVDPVVAKVAKDAARLAAEMNSDLGLSAAVLEPVYQRLFAREHADALATGRLDKFVQLIYAGNAVQFPSACMSLTLVVAGSDPVTIGVGKYFGFAKGSKTKMTDVAGGHGFNANYAPTVAQLIIADLEARQK